ncbi:hypothetical protein D3C81_2294740 [compost metagenome]
MRFYQRQHRVNMVIDLSVTPVVSIAQYMEHVGQFQGVVLRFGTEGRLLLDHRQVAVRRVLSRTEQYQVAKAVQ